MFLRVPQAIRIYCRCHAVQARETFRKYLTKSSEQAVAPDCNIDCGNQPFPSYLGHSQSIDSFPQLGVVVLRCGDHKKFVNLIETALNLIFSQNSKCKISFVIPSQQSNSVGVVKSEIAVVVEGDEEDGGHAGAEALEDVVAESGTEAHRVPQTTVRPVPVVPNSFDDSGLSLPNTGCPVYMLILGLVNIN